MRTIRTVLVGICVMASAPSHCQDTAIEAKEKRIEQRTCPAVSNGLVFVEGEFLPPPYVVSRVRNAIYINGRYIEASAPWPSEKKAEDTPLVPIFINPIFPSAITEKTSKYDSVFIQYIHEKRCFLFKTYGTEKGIEMMVDIYKSLPCIKDAKREVTSNSIIITWKSGRVDHVTQVPPQRSQNNGTPEQAAKMFDGICDIYSKGLEFNDYFIFGSAYTTGTQDGFGRFLVPLAKALRTEKDEEAFVTVMTNKFPMSTGFSEKAFRSFYKHRDMLPQWEPLLKKRCKGRE